MHQSTTVGRPFGGTRLLRLAIAAVLLAGALTAAGPGSVIEPLAADAQGATSVTLTPTADMSFETYIENPLSCGGGGALSGEVGTLAEPDPGDGGCPDGAGGDSGPPPNTPNPNGGSNTLAIGGTDWGDPAPGYATRWTTVVDFDLASLPADAVVTQALLTVEARKNGDAVRTKVSPVTGSWTESSTSLPARASSPETIDIISPGVDTTLDVTAPVQAWKENGWHGLGLALDDGATPGKVEIYSREKPAFQATLDVTYVEDAVPPTVQITAPSFGDQVWDQIELSADASDNAGVDRVEFTIGDTTIGTDTTAPFSAVWDTTSVPDGDHLVTATAYDPAGNSASDTVGLRVANGLDVTGQLDSDFEAGRITADEYVLNAVYAIVGDAALGDRYTGTVPDHPSMWLWRVLLLGDQVSAETQDEIRAHLVPQISEQPTTGGMTTQSIGEVDCSSLEANLKSLLSPLECRVPAGSVDVWWDADNPPPDVDSNGIPDKVEAYGQAFIDAQGHFEAVLGYPPTGHIDALLGDPHIACGVSPPPMDFLIPGGQRTILLNPECPEPAYLAMHELFHQYQWDYLSPWDFAAGVEATKEISWWGEATAEWAGHQVLAANDAVYGGTDDRFAYADLLPAFMNTAWQHIDDLGQGGNARQYGAFAVAEWLHHATADPASIQRTFEAISFLTSPTEAIDGELDGTWNAQIPAMWRDLYFLDLPIAGTVDKAETDAWRDLLDRGGVFGNVGRPAAVPLTLAAGDSEIEAFRLGAAGAKFIEIGSSDPGTLNVELFSSDPSVDLQVLALEGYDTDPTVAPAECAPSTVETISGTRLSGSVEFSRSPVTASS